jgi:enoyl-CoA hydratase/carnithine racemase
MFYDQRGEQRSWWKRLQPHAHEAERGLTRPGWEQELMRFRRNKPIIGAVDRYCLGQGLIHLLLLTEIRPATPVAEFDFPEIAYSMGGAGGLNRLGLLRDKGSFCRCPESAQRRWSLLRHREKP